MWNLCRTFREEDILLPYQGVKVEEVITSYTLLVHVAMQPDMPHCAILRL